jgi:GDPmannose 4,6-dehydratase
MKRVVVVGSGGQDGRLLTERLAGEGSAILGVERNRLTGRETFSVELPPSLDVTDASQVRQAIAAARPDEVYYLAAYHHSSSEQADSDVAALLRLSQEVHVTGLVNVLEALVHEAPRCRIFYAASSHVFGAPTTPVQNESTPLEPRSIYGITKTAGIHACRLYREQHGLHASVGILYNHESHYRARKFVSQRIVLGAMEAAAAKRDGRTIKLELGSLASVVDWGYAPDYVDAMIRVLARDTPDDYVVATGVPHTIGDFVKTAFGQLGLDWRDHVEEKAALIHRRVPTLVGDPTKLKNATGWRPSLDFEQMVSALLRHAPRI